MRISKIGAAVLCMIAISCDQSPERVKLERYRVAGERLFSAYCANCHQSEGEGFRKLYPPIDRPELFTRDLERVICIAKTGSNDSITVRNIQYNLPMPPSGLTNLEIAEIVTYMGNSWENDIGLIDVGAVGRILKNCAD